MGNSSIRKVDWMVLAAQNALFTGNKKVVETRNRARAHIKLPNKVALRSDPRGKQQTLYSEVRA